MSDPVSTLPPSTERRRPTWTRLKPTWPTVVIVAIVGIVFALPMRALFRYQGPPMEEGFMLVFPEQVLRGAVPHRDFLHLYGPGSLWVLASVFKVFGTSIWSERTVGLLQQVGLIAGVFTITRPWGRRVATGGAVIAAVII